jgi:hypothetical protein
MAALTQSNPKAIIVTYHSDQIGVEEAKALADQRPGSSTASARATVYEDTQHRRPRSASLRCLPVT